MMVNNEALNGSIIASLTQTLHQAIGSMKVIPRLVERVVSEEMWQKYIQKPTGKVIEHASFRELVEAPLLDGLGTSVEELKQIRDQLDELIRLIECSV